MKVQDIMTRDVQTCTTNTTLPQVVKLMREATCGIIPVIDAHGRTAGVVTDRDISMALIETARKEGRIGKVPYEPQLPVLTAWDLGVGDSTAIWFLQQSGREVRAIDYYEADGEGLAHYAKVLQDRGYVYAAGTSMSGR